MAGWTTHGISEKIWQVEISHIVLKLISTKTIFCQILFLSQLVRKYVLCHMWTTKTQISLHICAVWLAPLLLACKFLDSIISIILHIAKVSRVQTGFSSWPGRFESYLVTNTENTYSHDVAHLCILFTGKLSTMGEGMSECLTQDWYSNKTHTKR